MKRVIFGVAVALAAAPAAFARFGTSCA